MLSGSNILITGGNFSQIQGDIYSRGVTSIEYCGELKTD